MSEQPDASIPEGAREGEPGSASRLGGIPDAAQPGAPREPGEPNEHAATGVDSGPGVEFARRMWNDDVASRSLGMTATTIEADHAVVRMPIRDDMVNGHGICHGGFIFTLADSCFALACNSRGRLTVAAGADIAFTAPARLGDVLVAHGLMRGAYGRNGLTDVTVKRESDGQIVAEFRGRSRSPKRP